MSPEEDRTHGSVDSEPKHYQRAIPAPVICEKATLVFHCLKFVNLMTADNTIDRSAKLHKHIYVIRSNDSGITHSHMIINFYNIIPKLT